MKWFLVIFALILFSICKSNKDNNLIKKKLLPELGYRLSGLLASCKDEHFKKYVELHVEKAITKLLPQEQDNIIKNTKNKDSFLSKVILHCYKQYIQLRPEKKRELGGVLEGIYLELPRLIKQELTISDLPEGWTQKHKL